MKKQYRRQSNRWLLMLWGAGATLSGWAQPEPPPVQWQRAIEGSALSVTATVRAAKTSNGGYAVLAGKNLIRLTAAGDILSNNPVTGAYQDSLATYAPVRETKALAPTVDGGAAVLALDVLNLYVVTKSDATGNRAWTRPVASSDAGSGRRVTADALGTAPDGSLLVAGTFTDALTYLTLTKVSPAGYITGQWRLRFSDGAQALSPVIQTVLPTDDGGFLLAGRALTTTGSSQGLALKLDKSYNLTWQRAYPAVDSLLDVVAVPSGSGTYTALGRGAGNTLTVLTIAPNGPTDGNAVATVSGSYGPASLANDGTGNLAILDATSLSTGDFRLTNVGSPSGVRWTKLVGGTGNDVPGALLAATGGGYVLVGTTTSTDGDVVGKPTTATAAWVVRVGTAPVSTALTLVAPTYNCQTGAIVFNTTGGDGTPITYTSPGINRARNTDNFGTVEPGVRNDPKVLVIQATQSGKTVSYAFDFANYCQNLPPEAPAAPNALMLIPPTYNCRTGAITFHTSGGDGTPIEYAAPGITTWTTNPNQFVEPGVRTDYTIQPLTLMARQGGKVVMFVFDLKAECGRARIGADEPTSGLTVSVVGNPVRDAVRVLITGVEGQPLLMHLLDERGQLVEHRSIQQAGATEQQTFNLQQQAPGVLLLRTTTNGQVQTVKVIKQ